MRTICLTSSLLIFSFSLHAQLSSISIGTPTSNIVYGSVSYYDPSRVGQKTTNIITYADIDGMPYWKEEWNPAILYLKGGDAVKLKSVKLNLYTSDVLYINDKGVEMEAATGIIQKIMFLSNKDSTKVLGIFDAFRDDKTANGFSYYRIIADGKWKLLEMKRSFIRKVPGTAMSEKKIESSFYTESVYAIAEKEVLSPIKSLNYSNITSVVPLNKDREQWLSANKNNLKKESDVASFITYCNTKEAVK